MKRSIAVLGIVAFALGGNLPSPAHAGTITFDRSQLREDYSNEVAVSGEVRVGVVWGSTSGPTETAPLSLHVRLPERGPRRLCVRLTSRDGRYRAEGSVLLTDDQKGDTVVALPTRYGDHLSKKRDETYLAPMVTLGDDEHCRGKVQAILAAHWGDSDPGGKITVLVNSGGLATSLSYSAPQGRGRKECQALKGTQLLAFDTACELEMVPGMQDLVIERHEFSDVLRVPLPLMISGPSVP